METVRKWVAGIGIVLGLLFACSLFQHAQAMNINHITTCAID